MNIANLLDTALRTAGIPIVGVSIGDNTNRATWVVTFLPAATPAQRTQAATLVQTIVVDQAAIDDADAASAVDDKVLKALVIWLAGKFSITPAAARSQILAIYRGLP